MPKWLSIFLTDPKYRIRFIFLILVIGIFIFQAAVVFIQNKRVKTNSKKIKQALAHKNNQPIEPEPQKPKPVSVPLSEKYIFSGSFIEGEDSYVIINGEVYAKGASLDQYIIDEVTPQSVILLNPQTKERANLYYQYTEEEKTLFGRP